MGTITDNTRGIYRPSGFSSSGGNVDPFAGRHIKQKKRRNELASETIKINQKKKVKGRTAKR